MRKTYLVFSTEEMDELANKEANALAEKKGIKKWDKECWQAYYDKFNQLALENAIAQAPSLII